MIEQRLPTTAVDRRLLADKVAIVAGASRRIGAATALAFADVGAKIAPAARDYADAGIRVNAVVPGPIASHRLGSVHEVAATVCWLCSEQPSFITGATIPLDGDLLAGGA